MAIEITSNVSADNNATSAGGSSPTPLDPVMSSGELNDLAAGTDAPNSNDDIDEIVDVTSNEKKGETSKNLTETLINFGLPIGLVVVGLAIIFGLVLPQLNNSIQTYGEIQSKTDELVALIDRYNRVLTLQNITNEQTATLNTINNLIPQGETNTTEFLETIQRKADEFDLDGSNPTISDNIVSAQTSNNSTVIIDGSNLSMDLLEVQAEFSATGDFDDIRDFLNSFYEDEDFIIIKEMEIVKSNASNSGEAGTQLVGDNFSTERGSDVRWTINITLVKYQFGVAGGSVDDLPRYYFNQPGSETQRPNQQVVDFINENFGN